MEHQKDESIPGVRGWTHKQAEEQVQKESDAVWADINARLANREQLGDSEFEDRLFDDIQATLKNEGWRNLEHGLKDVVQETRDGDVVTVVEIPHHLRRSGGSTNSDRIKWIKGDMPSPGQQFERKVYAWKNYEWQLKKNVSKKYVPRNRRESSPAKEPSVPEFSWNAVADSDRLFLDCKNCKKDDARIKLFYNVFRLLYPGGVNVGFELKRSTAPDDPTLEQAQRKADEITKTLKNPFFYESLDKMYNLYRTAREEYKRLDKIHLSEIYEERNTIKEGLRFYVAYDEEKRVPKPKETLEQLCSKYLVVSKEYEERYSKYLEDADTAMETVLDSLRDMMPKDIIY